MLDNSIPGWLFNDYSCIMLMRANRLVLADIELPDMPTVRHLDIPLSPEQQTKFLGGRLAPDEVVIDITIGSSPTSWIDPRVTVPTGELVTIAGRQYPIVRVLPTVEREP